jgi:hypothetical protein
MFLRVMQCAVLSACVIAELDVAVPVCCAEATDANMATPSATMVVLTGVETLTFIIISPLLLCFVIAPGDHIRAAGTGDLAGGVPPAVVVPRPPLGVAWPVDEYFLTPPEGDSAVGVPSLVRPRGRRPLGALTNGPSTL